MHEGTLREMRRLLRRGDYVLTDHAEQELAADELSLFDLERVVSSGTIVARQEDAVSGEWKYVMECLSARGEWVAAVAKISRARKLIFLTVFRL
jgi:hypothetical protein